jgi:hypothetical protein
MNELIHLARIAGKGSAAEVALQNRLGGNLRKRDAFRRSILKRATAEERRIADFARDYSGSDFRVLCSIAARHGEGAA